MSNLNNLTSHTHLHEAIHHALLMRIAVSCAFPANADGVADVEQRTVSFVGPEWNDFLHRASIVAANATVEWLTGNPLPARCPSCDHYVAVHQPDGCRFAVTVGTPGQALNCPCAHSYQRG